MSPELVSLSPNNLFLLTHSYFTTSVQILSSLNIVVSMDLLLGMFSDGVSSLCNPAPARKTSSSTRPDSTVLGVHHILLTAHFIISSRASPIGCTIWRHRYFVILHLVCSINLLHSLVLLYLVRKFNLITRVASSCSCKYEILLIFCDLLLIGKK